MTKNRVARFASFIALFGALLLIATLSSLPVQAASPDIVISQVYGGGGNSSAPYKNDFIELYNRGTLTVDVTGWSVQYASSTGSSWQVTALSGSIQSGKYYLVQEAAGTSCSGAPCGAALPVPNATGSIPMAAGSGKVALVNNSTAFTVACPTGVIDFVGYGSANCSETAPTLALSNITAALRNGNGTVDTGNNLSDFTVGAPNPRNTPPLDAAPSVASTVPANGGSGVALNTNITITFSEPVNVTGAWFSLTCSLSGAHTAAVTGGATTFTLNPNADFAIGETCTVTVIASQVTDLDTIDPPDALGGNYSWSFTTIPLAALIHDIQGAGHLSPLQGRIVSTQGIVTAKKGDGFFLQDPNPDANPATSEGIYVYTGSKPTMVNVGDKATVAGKVSEYRASSGPGNLTLTELNFLSVSVQSTGNALPAATLVGNGGRMPHTTVIENDATSGDVETSGVFDPNADGLDFYESLEGMLVQINDAVVVGPSNNYWEVPVLPDGGARAALRTSRGGILARPNDFNPERMVIDDEVLKASNIATVPLNVGDRLNGALVGPLYYDFGLFMVELTALPSVTPGGLMPETIAPAAAGKLAVATFNVENLSAKDPVDKFSRLANLIVNNLGAPDLLAVEEIQDKDGSTNSGTVDAKPTYDKLIAAILTAGGPTYEYRQIDPENNKDGGATGGNIRQGFLFRTDRGLAFVDRPGGTSTGATSVVGSGSSTHLSYSPGRIDPTNGAFTDSRKPLAGEFTFKGTTLFVIANHFNSKGGDTPLFGHFQPPQLTSEVQRVQQAQVVNAFVDALLAADPRANIVVLGDLNDFEFAPPLAALKGTPPVLRDLIEALPEKERYTYVFEGNSQTLDHILLSQTLASQPYLYKVVHVNAEFADQASDHDPQVVQLNVTAPPSKGPK